MVLYVERTSALQSLCLAEATSMHRRGRQLSPMHQRYSAKMLTQMCAGALNKESSGLTEPVMYIAPHVNGLVGAQVIESITISTLLIGVNIELNIFELYSSYGVCETHAISTRN